jgi:hypothetical protein
MLYVRFAIGSTGCVDQQGITIKVGLFAHIYSSCGTSSVCFMCEFCSFGPNSTSDPDSRHHQFAGFFSADAIEAAVRQAQQNEDLYSDEESDGT